MASRSDVLPFDVDIDGERAVVGIPGSHFGTADNQSPGNTLLAFIEQLAQPEVVLDFEKVYFLSSVGLTILLTLHKRLRMNGRRLTVLNLQPHVYDVFTVTHLNEILDVRQQQAA
jgi:anti-anti-sigma factor